MEIIILEVIEQQYESLSKGQKLIADFVLKNPAAVAKMTTAELSQRVSVSAATVVRFCQRLNVETFDQFRMAIVSEISAEQSDLVDTVIEADDSLDLLARKVSKIYSSSTEKVLGLLDLSQLEKVIQLVDQAKTVYLLGIGTSGIVAYDLYHRMNRYGIKTFYETDAHMNLEFLSNATTEDVVIAISYSGKTKEVNVGVRNARGKNINVVAITRDQASPLQSLANINLLVPNNERLVRVSAITSKISTMFVTDLLFMGLMRLHFDHAYTSAIDTNEIVHDLKE
ncbi:MurR/RpiR family transcriptional regulator [Lactiplantibacillus fabifermentans]|uniref:Transcriptional regulator n=2 Tax=Lactiplantibacillus fabifermentans TaxID=483011 RepID=A0A0R2NS45_9LACO|nr:MurR/RpiR family transcriptional regulator [Lactiplantibacillus fabifermentans]ETY73056.1 hypothetical protein LFAB_14380 [Lactiplantibacillus fabifermentans T30PCM01]KRO28529.1 transcriptional regulator [Lactiplantibacillus fabifermentans DSM 21115]